MASSSVMQGCIPDTFTNLSIFGAEIIAVDANVVTNYNFDVPAGWRFSQPAIIVDNATFCNVTVSYTHPGQNDAVNAEVWLPPEDSWNGKLQANGGGGWVAGRYILAYGSMAGAIVDGYAAASTDAGVTTDSLAPDWVLASPGNLDLVNLDNFGQRSLGDLAVISKKVIECYYGKPAEYSYWNGCSNGGRQASILAQQYPDAYDGIIAAAPASYWAELAMDVFWPAFFMDSTKQYPRSCELDRITSLAITKCDDLDGIKDGLIANPEACRASFNVWDYVGTTFRCADTGLDTQISTAAASVTEALWDGPKFSNGDFMWYGYEIGANLSVRAGITCSNNGTCVPNERLTVDFWYSEFINKDPTADVTTLSHAEFDELYLTLKRTFAASVEASEARITRFRDLGGKMITYHGLADDTITPQSTLHYYEEVSRLVTNVTDFYRYYRVPGLEHCFGGNGGQPIHLFDQLRRWVEDGTAPDASPVVITLPRNDTMDEVICPWPKEAILQRNCSNENAGDCWSCR